MTTPKQIADRLEPCPFCGGERLAFVRPCTDGGLGVICHTCHTTMDSRVESEAKAIAAWNTRALRQEPDDPSVEEIGWAAEAVLSRHTGRHLDPVQVADEVAQAILDLFHPNRRSGTT